MTGVSEYDVLHFLSRAGKFGFPFSNMAHNDLRKTDPRDYLETLRSLENKGFVKFSGLRTLADFAGLIEEKSTVLVPAAEQDGQRKDNANKLFYDDHEFFLTSIRPTLRGLFALALHNLDKDKLANTLAVDKELQEVPEPKQALTDLIAKREAEARKEEAERPVKAFEEVVYSLGRGEDKDPKEWGYATEYWKQLEWDTLAAHKRLMETNPEYSRAFANFKRGGEKIGIIMEATADKLQFGQHPANGLVLSALFGVVARPISAYKFVHGLSTMKEIFLADREKPAVASSTPSSPGPV